MILLTPKFSESFENSKKENVGMLEINQEKDCFSSYLAENECTKLYNEEYVEVFSPTVFETVEIYTSSSSGKSENVEANNSADPSFTGTQPSINPISNSDIRPVLGNEIGLSSVGTAVSTLENLQPGTYTLDVLESSDFDFDAVFVDSSANFESNMDDNCENTFGDKTPRENDSSAVVKGDNSLEDGTKIGHRLRKSRPSSIRKPLATKYPIQNVTARQFLHNFSNDLRNTEGKVDHEDESKSLSWLLYFKISSIFNPMENEADNSEKCKKKSSDCKKKPRYTYTELIEQALKENGELTVSGIYNWISKHYPYYQQNDDRWKNSVRHNLSINPQFRKGKKASQGAGHFWNISDSSVQSSESHTNQVTNKNPSPQVKNKTIKSITGTINQIDDEVLAATKSIQENENMDFTDVCLHDAVDQQLPQIEDKNAEASFLHISRKDIENLWESTYDTSDQRFTSFSPLIREITEDSNNMEDENFLIQDINNSICLGDELFAEGLQSPYNGLTIL